MIEGFRLWLLDRVPAQAADETAASIEKLLMLRADYMDLHDPGMWTAEITRFVLTELIPWKVAQRREDSVLIIPRLGAFFEYLQEHGQWSRFSMPPAAAHAMLEGMDLDVLEAADDPTRRSMSGNILAYAVELGIDLGSPGLLDSYMHWYNSLPHEERIELSDTGRLRSPSRPFDPEARYEDPLTGPGGSRGGSVPPRGGSAFGPAVDAARAGVPFGGGMVDGGFAGGPGFPFAEGPWNGPAVPSIEDTWPAVLGDPPESSDEEFDPADLLRDAMDNVFVQRARAILELVGDGVQVTSTGALRVKDTDRLCETLGLEPRKTRSMWDRPEIAEPYTALIEGEWLEASASRIRPGDGLADPCDPLEDGEGFTTFAIAVLTRHFLSRMLTSSRDGGFSGLPLTLPAILKAGTAGGLDLPDPFRALESLSSLSKDDLTPEQVQELGHVFGVDRDLRTLATAGALARDDRHFQADGVALIAMGNAASIVQMQGLSQGEWDDEDEFLDDEGWAY